MSNLSGNVITSLRRSNILRWLSIITFGLIWNVYIAPSAKKNQSSSQSRHWMSGQIPTCCYLFLDWLFLVLFIILKSYFTKVCVYFFVFRLNGLVYLIMLKKKRSISKSVILNIIVLLSVWNLVNASILVLKSKPFSWWLNCKLHN